MIDNGLQAIGMQKENQNIGDTVTNSDLYLVLLNPSFLPFLELLVDLKSFISEELVCSCCVFIIFLL